MSPVKMTSASRAAGLSPHKDVSMSLTDYTASSRTTDLHHLLVDLPDAGESATAHAMMCCHRDPLPLPHHKGIVARHVEHQAARADGLCMLQVPDLYANSVLAAVLRSICASPNGTSNIRHVWCFLSDWSAVTVMDCCNL